MIMHELKKARLASQESERCRRGERSSTGNTSPETDNMNTELLTGPAGVVGEVMGEETRSRRTSGECLAGPLAGAQNRLSV
jgi:hypothetical protein